MGSSNLKPKRVATQQDHLCGSCRKVIPAGSQAFEVQVPMRRPDINPNRDVPCTVPVRYHEECAKHLVG